MTIADETYTDCGEIQQPDWWADRCSDCGHGLLIHRNLDSVMVCDMCALAAEITHRAKTFANGLKDQAVAYVDKKQSEAKTYIDTQDAQVKADSKSYIDTQDQKYQGTAKAYVDQQIPKVIVAKVIPSALVPGA